MEVVHKVKQVHKCHVCSGVEFESEILLNSHMASVHTKKIKCKNCDFSCISSAQLFEHVVKNHGAPPKKQLYKCQVCSGVEFESEILLNSHTASIHTNKIECEKCDFSCKSTAQLFEHVVKKHGPKKQKVVHKAKQVVKNDSPPPKKQLYKCQVCSGVEFESDILLKSHIASVHTMKIKCKNCDFRCVTSAQLLEHMVQNHGPKKQLNKQKIMYKCHKCSGVEFESEILLNSHTASIHTNKIPTAPIHTNKLKCKKCDFSCETSGQLCGHIGKNHRPKKQLHKCQVCSGVEFENEILLNSHTASVHTNKIKCEKCEFTCKSTAQLFEHIVKNHSPKTKQKKMYKCHKCGVEFESEILLNSHTASLSIHGNTIECEKCHFSCKTTAKLSEHIVKNHSPKKQLYKCQVCSGVEFESEILLNSHIASIHYEMIKCEICDLNFISKEELWEHLDKYHDWKLLHECNACGAEFENKVLLNSHIVNDHCKIKCEFCDSRFISEAQLGEHMDKEHEKKQALFLNLPKPVPLVSTAAQEGIPAIATKESSTERYLENN